MSDKTGKADPNLRLVSGDEDPDVEANTETEVPLPPLAQTIEVSIQGPLSDESSDVIEAHLFAGGSADSGIYPLPGGDDEISTRPTQPTVLPGERLQLVKFARRGNTLVISGLTPHGRRLTFEQKEDREGWYVVAAGRRRRPTRRELGLVVASITQEMEAAAAPDDDERIHSAYRLALSSDQPGLPLKGIEAYRDLLLDDADAYTTGQIERLCVVAIHYQAFKRFAIRHGHRIGAAFVEALGERIHRLFRDDPQVYCFHKFGKSFRMIVVDKTTEEVRELVDEVTSFECRDWIARRVWGDEPRTHVDEINFYIGIARALPLEHDVDSVSLAQRLNDDAYRAAKLGQMKGHDSINTATTSYQTTVEVWHLGSDDELEVLAEHMDDGPAAVMAEMADFLHELVPADLEGMAVEGDTHALVHTAIARDGFWQGTTAMRIASERVLDRFMHDHPTPADERDFVGGFEFGDEFYGIGIERDRFYFAWGDLNSAGATRVRAGLDRLRTAVGWGRPGGGGIVGEFVQALDPDGEHNLLERVRAAAQRAFQEVDAEEAYHINDAVDIADYLYTLDNEAITNEDLEEGCALRLVLPHSAHDVEIVERGSKFSLLLRIDGIEHAAALSVDASSVPQVKLRVRKTVVSASLCILEMQRHELDDILAIVREDNDLSDDSLMDIIGFLRHIADVLLAEHIKTPAKIGLALGDDYDVQEFIRAFTLERIRERHPGLFYEAVHHYLLHPYSGHIDRQLSELIGHNMLRSARPH